MLGPTHRRGAALLAACLLAGAGCGGDDPAPAAPGRSSTTEASADVLVCDAYLTIGDIHASEVPSDEALGLAIGALLPEAADDEELQHALTVLAPGGDPTPSERSTALAALDEAFGADCAEEPTEPTECPPPEVLEAEGYTCDGEGNLTPREEPEHAPECPAPEVLEAEGLTCDAEGNLEPKQ